VTVFALLAAVAFLEATAANEPGTQTDIRNLQNAYEVQKNQINVSEEAIAILTRFVESDVILYSSPFSPRGGHFIPLTEKQTITVIKAALLSRMKSGQPAPAPTAEEIRKGVIRARQDTETIKKGLRQEIEILENFVTRARKSNVEIANMIGAMKKGPAKEQKRRQQRKTKIHNPKIDKGLLDNCFYFARECGGKRAADEFCRLHEFSSVSPEPGSFELDYDNTGNTVVIGEEREVNGRKNPKRLCSPKGGSGTTASPTGKCVSFKYIICQ